MDNLTPKAIVAALDDHIIGQKDAKRAVAVALRNRWRRQRLGPELRDEVTPKNILMIRNGSALAGSKAMAPTASCARSSSAALRGERARGPRRLPCSKAKHAATVPHGCIC